MGWNVSHVCANVEISKVTDSLPFPCAICRKSPWLSDSLSSSNDRFLITMISISIFTFLLTSSGLQSCALLFFPGFLHPIFCLFSLSSPPLFNAAEAASENTTVDDLFASYPCLITWLAAMNLNFFCRLASLTDPS